jgi:hypothetical protein
MLYLPDKDWSPRFGTEFFTFSLTSRSILEVPPDCDSNDHTNAQYQRQRHSSAAVYFHVLVKCAKSEKLCLRRFSQFRTLYDEVLRSPPAAAALAHQSKSASKNITTSTYELIQNLHFPPKTCFFTHADDEFLDVRQEELGAFLDELLKIPNCSTHPAVQHFLELDGFKENDPS